MQNRILHRAWMKKTKRPRWKKKSKTSNRLMKNCKVYLKMDKILSHKVEWPQQSQVKLKAIQLIFKCSRLQLNMSQMGHRAKIIILLMIWSLQLIKVTRIRMQTILSLNNKNAHHSTNSIRLKELSQKKSRRRLLKDQTDHQVLSLYRLKWKKA